MAGMRAGAGSVKKHEPQGKILNRIAQVGGNRHIRRAILPKPGHKIFTLIMVAG